MRTINLLISEDNIPLGYMTVSVISARGNDLELMVHAAAAENTYNAMNDALDIIGSAFEVMHKESAEIKYAS